MKVLLVDDHRLFRDLLADRLVHAPGVFAVLTASTAEEAIDLVARERPEIVLTEINLPGKDGCELIGRIRELDPGCQVLLLSDCDCDSSIRQALDAGVRGYVLKYDSFDDVVRAIASVMEGGLFFSERILNRLSVEDGRLKLARPRNGGLAALTPRERELLAHLAKGTGLKAAAAVMHISYKTADNQKASLMRKLDIHDRVELARFAIRERIVGST